MHFCSQICLLAEELCCLSKIFLNPTRVFFPHFGQTSARLDRCTGAGKLIRWPFSPPRRDFKFFVRRLIPSTLARSILGNTCNTLPVFPRLAPANILTVSLVFIFILIKEQTSLPGINQSRSLALSIYNTSGAREIIFL